MTSPRVPSSRARSWSSISTTTTWAARWPSIWRRAADSVTLRDTGRSRLGLGHHEQRAAAGPPGAGRLRASGCTRCRGSSGFERRRSVTLANLFTGERAAPAVPIARDRRRAVRRTMRCTARSCARADDLERAGHRLGRRGSAMRWRPGRSCTPCTAGTATRASSTRTPRSACTYRRDAPLTDAHRMTTASPQEHDLRMNCRHPCGPGADAALELVPLGGHLCAREGAHFLPRMAVRRRARRSSPRPAPIGCSIFSAKASSWCATAKAHLRAFYNVCRHRGSRLCRTDDAASAGHGSASAAVIAGRSHRLPLPSMDLRSRRPPHRRAAT